MAKAASKPTNWADRIRRELKRDPKRTAVMAVLAAVMVVVGGRLMVKQVLPGAAGAAEAPRARKAAAQRAAAAATAAKETGAKAPRGVPEGPAVVDRDLFAPNPALFPMADTVAPAPVVTPAVDEAAVKEAQREATRQAVMTLARALSLQSTVIGSAGPTAIINGQVLKTGEWVNGFEVVEITSRSCTVLKDGMRVTLEMAK